MFCVYEVESRFEEMWMIRNLEEILIYVFRAGGDCQLRVKQTCAGQSAWPVIYILSHRCSIEAGSVWHILKSVPFQRSAHNFSCYAYLADRMKLNDMA